MVLSHGLEDLRLRLLNWHAYDNLSANKADRHSRVWYSPTTIEIFGQHDNLDANTASRFHDHSQAYQTPALRPPSSRYRLPVDLPQKLRVPDHTITTPALSVV